MSFRKYGGLNYAKSNNIVHNHIANSDVLGVSDHIGATGSQIICDSELIVKDDITSENLTVNNRIRTEYISGPTGVGATGVLKMDSELYISKDIRFESRPPGDPQGTIYFSDGTSQFTSISTTDTYWQPIGDPLEAIYYTGRTIIGVNPSESLDQMAANGVNFAVRGQMGVLGDLRVGTTGTTFVSKFVVHSDGRMGVDGGATFYDTVSVLGGATFESNVGISGALDVSGPSTFRNTLSVLGGIIFSGGVGISGELGVSGPSTLRNTLSVLGGATFANNVGISGALDVSGPSTFATLRVTSGATFGNSIDVASSSIFRNGIDVTSGSTFRGNVNVIGLSTFDTLRVTSGATFGSGIDVTSGSTFKSNVNVIGLSTFATLRVTSGATFGNGIDVTSGSTFRNGIDVTSGSTFRNGIDVTSGSTFRGNVNVTGLSTFATLTVTSGATFGSSIDVTSGSTFRSNVNVTGTATAGSFNATSDYRIKKNVRQITANVDSLNPVQYFNTLSNREDFGLIAHEIQEHFPTLVCGEKDGPGNQSVNYIGIIPILVSEIQELKKKVNELMSK
jgi:hypothetical protein